MAIAGPQIRSPIEDQILDAAEALMARLGYAKMTMQDIAERAGLGRRTLYLHYPSREEVALCTIDRIVERLLARMNAIACGADSAQSRLEAMLVLRVMHRFDSVRDYYQNFNAMFASLRSAYLARREGYFAAEIEALREVIDDGVQAGVFAPCDAAETARTLLTATNALLPYSLSAAELGLRESVEHRAAAVAELVVRGLTCAPGKSSPLSAS